MKRQFGINTYSLYLAHRMTGILIKNGIFCLFLVSSFSCVACAQLNPVANKPSGEAVFNAFFGLFDKKLDSSEAMCEQHRLGTSQPLLMREYFSQILSAAHQPHENKHQLSSDCTLAQFQMNASKVIEVWDCTIWVMETNQRKEFISSSNITFSLDLKTHAYIGSSLRCN